MRLEAESTNESLRQAWGHFAAAGSYDEYCQYWLELMCPRIYGVKAAFLVIEHGEEGFRPTASWPEKSKPDEELLSLIEEGIEKATGLVHALAGGTQGLAFPVRVDGELAGLVAMEVNAPKAVLPEIMEKIQWGSAWIELLLRRHRAQEAGERLERLSGAVDLLGAVLVEPDFNSAALTFVNELAAAFECDRVSFGMARRGQVHVTALSHTAKFGKKMNLIRRLSGVMSEAVLQRGVINYKAGAEGKGKLVVREHAQYSHAYGNASLLSIPLHSGEDYFGVTTMERPAERPFTEQEVSRTRSIVALSGEALRTKHYQDSTWYQHLGRAVRTQLERLFGVGYLGRKLVLAGLALAVVFFLFAEGTYRVAADSVLEGSVRRAVVAPFDGYIEKADVKAGEQVSAGARLAQLDDRDLVLERLGYLSEQAKLQRQYEEAVAGRDRAEAKVLQAQLEQNAAQLKLVDSRLARTRLNAPFDALVISGDLSQRLGGAVEQGEVLFEVAPLDRYRVILWVDEHRMADVTAGLEGQLVLNALPETTFGFTVSRVTPVTEARDGGNYFRIEAELSENQADLRPGMEGVGKIAIGERNLFWIWTYPLRQWLSLKFWSWWP